MLGGRISARTSIGSVVINGDTNESQILAGADLGHDANFGGTARNADVVGSGSINSVRVNGNFKKSDIATTGDLLAHNIASSELPHGKHPVHLFG